MPQVHLVGGLPLAREALRARLSSRGVYVLPDAQHESSHAVSISAQADLFVVFCEDEAHWQRADEAVSAGVPVVAVVPDERLRTFARALSIGTCAVHCGQTSDAIADTIMAAANNQVLLPRDVACQLAEQAASLPRCSELTATELAMLQLVSEGETAMIIAEHLNFSPRTIRRKLSRVYVKLGASNRSDAVVRATRLGLLESKALLGGT